MNDSQPIRRFLRMSGIRDIEDRLLMDIVGGDKHLTSFSAARDKALYKLFGITERDTFFRYPDAYYTGELSEEERANVREAAAKHEAQFVTPKQKWEEDIVTYLRTLGWDLTDDRGHPLRITKHVCRVIEAVARGIAGVIPDTQVIDAESWAERLQQEAAQFRRRSKRS